MRNKILISNTVESNLGHLRMKVQFILFRSFIEINSNRLRKEVLKNKSIQVHFRIKY